MNNTKVNEERVVKDYERVYGKRSQFTDSVEALVRAALDKEKVKYHVIEKRTKTVSSFKEKLCRKGYEDPLRDFPDLSGVRVILYYPDQVDHVCSILNKIFKPIEIVDKRELLEPDQFGYLSVHLVAEITKERASLVEWSDFEGYKVEIQVRTILQHSWAMVSHALMYKRDTEAPRSIQRKLHRLAGLFEIADEYFVSIRDSERTLSKEMDISLKKEEDLEIDAVSISRFFAQKNIVDRLVSLGRSSDLLVGSESHAQCFSDLIYATKLAGIKTINALKRNLDFDPQQIKKYFALLQFEHITDIKIGSSPYRVGKNERKKS